jgi:hypothetical protein
MGQARLRLTSGRHQLTHSSGQSGKLGQFVPGFHYTMIWKSLMKTPNGNYLADRWAIKCSLYLCVGAELGHDVTAVKDHTADYSDMEMRAALEVNLP